MLKVRTSKLTPQTPNNRLYGWLPKQDGDLAIIVLAGLLPQVLYTLINGGRTMKE